MFKITYMFYLFFLTERKDQYVCDIHEFRHIEPILGFNNTFLIDLAITSQKNVGSMSNQSER